MDTSALDQLTRIVYWLAGMATASTLASLYFIWRAHRIEKELHVFIADLHTQVQAYLATHNLWSDVAFKALEQGPALLEGGVRLTGGILEISQLINRSSRIAKAVKNVLGIEEVEEIQPEPVQPKRRGRPRNTNQPNEGDQ